MNFDAPGAYAQDYSDYEVLKILQEQSWECAKTYENKTIPGIDPNFYCHSHFDGLTCWPPTKPGDIVEALCPFDLHGVASVHRECFPNATWANDDIGVVYGADGECRCVHCLPLMILDFLGYGLSFLACVVAFFIFLCSSTLHCTRNRIHWHLISSFILKYLVYFMQYIVHVNNLHVTRIVVTILFYLELTNYFWMFVEGLYLHTLVVFALRIDADRIMFWVYCIIGWGIPMIFVGSWAIVSVVLNPNSGFIDPNAGEDAVIIHEYVCIIGPILLVLVINCFFLLNIVRLLMSKLRMHGNRTSDIQHYRQAARATLVLVVLLGVGYILFLCLPLFVTNLPPMGNLILKYINALLSSTQGLCVAIIYVFLNTEVKTVLRRKWRRKFSSTSLPCLCRKHPKPRTSSYSKYDDQTYTSTMRSMTHNETVVDCYSYEDIQHRRGNWNGNGSGKGTFLANGDMNDKKGNKKDKIEMDVVKTNGTVAKWDQTEEGKEVEEAEPLLESTPSNPTTATIVISEATPVHDTGTSLDINADCDEHHE